MDRLSQTRTNGRYNAFAAPSPPRDWHGGPFPTHGELAQGLSLTMRPIRTASPICFSHRSDQKAGYRQLSLRIFWPILRYVFKNSARCMYVCMYLSISREYRGYSSICSSKESLLSVVIPKSFCEILTCLSSVSFNFQLLVIHSFLDSFGDGIWPKTKNTVWRKRSTFKNPG